MNKIIVIIVLIALFLSCSRTDRDPVEPLLPQYSEQGVNAAGGIYNNEWAWFDICNDNIFYDDCQYIQILYDTVNATSTILFSGELFGRAVPMTVGFELNNIIIKSKNELMALDGQVINLDGISGRGILTRNNADTENGLFVCDEGEIESYGQLHIRRVASRINYAGDERIIFAGTFGFDLTSPCWEHSFYQGRFDYYVTSFRSI